MDIAETLSLMIAFATLIVLIMSDKVKLYSVGLFVLPPLNIS